MKLIVGLGNPGKQYEHTRHNAGFLALDYFMQNKDTISCQSKFDAQICEYHTSPFPSSERRGGDEVAGAVKVFIAKPQSYMNNSGAVVKEIVEYYKLNPKTDLLVIHDEVDLPLGTIRMVDGSSAAGHNGVQDIFDELGTKEIHRIRVGIEVRESRDELATDSFVLQRFTGPELHRLQSEVFPKVNQLIEEFLQK